MSNTAVFHSIKNNEHGCVTSVIFSRIIYNKKDNSIKLVPSSKYPFINPPSCLQPSSIKVNIEGECKSITGFEIKGLSLENLFDFFNNYPKVISQAHQFLVEELFFLTGYYKEADVKTYQDLYKKQQFLEKIEQSYYQIENKKQNQKNTDISKQQNLIAA